jgi:hypothetical protein
MTVLGIGKSQANSKVCQSKWFAAGLLPSFQTHPKNQNVSTLFLAIVCHLCRGTVSMLHVTKIGQG